MGVNMRIDGLTVLTGVAVAGGALLYVNRGKIGNMFNPTHEDNLAHRAANAAVGEENLTGFFDKYFAAQELLLETFTPFGDGDTTYARQVWGLP